MIPWWRNVSHYSLRSESFVCYFPLVNYSWMSTSTLIRGSWICMFVIVWVCHAYCSLEGEHTASLRRVTCWFCSSFYCYMALINILLAYWYLYIKKYILTAITAIRFERVDRDSSVGIAARRAEISGDGMPVGANFPYLYRFDLGFNQYSI